MSITKDILVITLKGEGQETRREAKPVEGYESLLGLHRTWGGIGYTVTHIPTGFVFSQGRTEKDAVDKALKICRVLTDAKTDIAAMRSKEDVPAELLKKIQRIRRAI